MPIEHSQANCPTCQRPVMIQRSVPNHLVHALVTLFLCGLWLPIWILASLSVAPWRCSQCGEAVRPAGNPSDGKALLWTAIVVISVVGGGIALATFFPPGK